MTNFSTPGVVAGGVIRSPRGIALSCKGWEQEAAMRMRLNSADPDVGAWRNQGADGDSIEGLRGTIAALRELRGDETLLLGAAGQMEVSRTQSEAPRLVIETTRLASEADTAAALWFDAGPQTGIPAAYESLAAVANGAFGGTLEGRLVAGCGLGRRGGALPLAATLNGAAFLGIDADAEQIKRRVKTGYCEVMVNDIDEALRILKNSVRQRQAASVGLIGNCAEVIPELARRGVVPDLLVDCTLGEGDFARYVPRGLSADQASESRRANASTYRERELDSLAAQIWGVLELKRLGSRVFAFADEFRKLAEEKNLPNAAVEVENFDQKYIRPVFSNNRVLTLWVALSGEPTDIVVADRLAADIFVEDQAAVSWLRLAAKHIQFQGLPARACMVPNALNARFALALNEMVARGDLKAPLAIGCVHQRGGIEAGIASEAPREPSGRISETQLASFSVGAARGSWVTMLEGAVNFWRWAVAVVADGTAEMAQKIERALAS